MKFSILSILLIGFSTNAYAMDVKEYEGIPMRRAPFSELPINDEVWSVSVISLSQWLLSNLQEEKKDMHTALLFEGVRSGRLNIDPLEENKPTFEADERGFWKLLVDFRVSGTDPDLFGIGKGAVFYRNTRETNGALEPRCLTKGVSEYKKLMSRTLLKDDVLQAIQEICNNQSNLGYSRGISLDPESAERGIFSCSTFSDAVLRCCGFFSGESTQSRELLNKGNHAGITPESFRSYYKRQYYYVPSNQSKWDTLLTFQKSKDPKITQWEIEDMCKSFMADIRSTVFTPTELEKKAASFHATMSIGQKILDSGKHLLKNIFSTSKECKNRNELEDDYKELINDINYSSLDFSPIQNLDKAFREDDVKTQYGIARIYDKGDYPEKAIKWYLKGAKQNHLKSFYRMGMIHYHLKDYDAALVYFSEAAKKNHDISLNFMGAIAHEKGEYTLAKKCYEEAAYQGCSEAQHNLGILYEEGKGVPLNEKMAEYWYEQAEKKVREKVKSNPNTMSFQNKSYAQTADGPFDENNVSTAPNSNNEEMTINETTKIFSAPEKRKMPKNEHEQNIFKGL